MNVNCKIAKTGVVVRPDQINSWLVAIFGTLFDILFSS